MLRGGGNQTQEETFPFGPPPDDWLEAARDDAFELWEENAMAFSVFLNAQTQWRTGMSGPTGLDYAGVAAMTRAMRIKMTPELFADLQTMERAVLNAMREK